MVSKYAFGHETGRHGCYGRKNTGKLNVSASRIQWNMSRTGIRPKMQKNKFKLYFGCLSNPGYIGDGLPINFNFQSESLESMEEDLIMNGIMTIPPRQEFNQLIGCHQLLTGAKIEGNVEPGTPIITERLKNVQKMRKK